MNTHRHLSKLPGMAIPKAAGAFPSRDSIIQYLDDYARKLDVPIDYGVSVQRIDRSDTNWMIETDAGVYTTRHVVVATGHDRVPHMPNWPGRETFEKPLIHVADFGDIANYRSKKVLVVGAGNSGTDILNHLATIETDKLWVSVRHGPVIFPTRLYGVPVQRLSAIFAKLPVRVVDSLLALTEHIAFGNLEKWGLQKHPQGGATRLLQTGTAPAIDNGFIAALKAGKVEVVPAIQRFESARVQLIDEQYIEPDIVIAATGYRTGLQPMLGHIDILDDLGAPTVHGSQQLDAYPGLWFTGMRPRLPGFFHMAGKIAQEIASAIEAKQLLKGVAPPDARINTAMDITVHK
jgi:cation diffusion facilitator CzcD-associated flavoprotein CzcO